LLKKTAFWGQHRNLEGLRIAVANSNPVVCAWNGALMVGFGRATSDGIYRAAIWDVVVHPDFQGKNLGTKIVQKISAHPLVRDVQRIYLMTSYQQSFYERLGFEVNNTTTMVAFNGKAGANAQLPIVFQQPIVDQPEAVPA
jgi:ribosomal protein S18 acetylase RimI-like enzyme